MLAGTSDLACANGICVFTCNECLTSERIPFRAQQSRNHHRRADCRHLTRLLPAHTGHAVSGRDASTNFLREGNHELQDRDFLSPKVNTETVLESKKGGGKDTTIFEIQQYDHAAQRQAAYKRAVDYEVHTVAHDPYGTLTHEVRYIADNLPLDFDDTTPEKDAIHGAHGHLKGDIYNAANNDMPVSIAKRFDINLTKLLHNNATQHPGLKAKSKLKPNTPIILQNRVIGERAQQRPSSSNVEVWRRLWIRPPPRGTATGVPHHWGRLSPVRWWDESA